MAVIWLPAFVYKGKKKGILDEDSVCKYVVRDNYSLTWECLYHLILTVSLWLYWRRCWQCPLLWNQLEINTKRTRKLSSNKQKNQKSSYLQCKVQKSRNMKNKSYLSFYFSWPYCGTCGILVPWPGIKPRQWNRGVLSTEPPGNSQQFHSELWNSAHRTVLPWFWIKPGFTLMSSSSAVKDIQMFLSFHFVLEYSWLTMLYKF